MANLHGQVRLLVARLGWLVGIFSVLMAALALGALFPEAPEAFRLGWLAIAAAFVGVIAPPLLAYWRQSSYRDAGGESEGSR